MDFTKMKEINERILEKAIPKVEKAMLNDQWDCECFEVMSMAIDNIKDVMKIGEMKEREPKYTEEKRKKNLAAVNEFDICVEDIISKHGREKAMDEILLLMSDIMDDLAILQPKIYDTIIMKLKALK